jgi:hypothetical protein
MKNDTKGAFLYLKAQIINLHGIKALFAKSDLVAKFNSIVDANCLLEVGFIDKPNPYLPTVTPNYNKALTQLRVLVDGHKNRKDLMPLFNALVDKFELDIEKLV